MKFFILESLKFIQSLVEFFDNNGRLSREQKTELLGILSDFEPADYLRTALVEEPKIEPEIEPEILPEVRKPVKKPIVFIPKKAALLREKLYDEELQDLVIYISTQSGSTLIRKHQTEILSFVQSQKIEVLLQFIIFFSKYLFFVFNLNF